MTRCDCPSDRHTRECVRERVAAERAAQGLPPTVTDEAARARIASIIASARDAKRREVSA